MHIMQRFPFAQQLSSVHKDNKQNDNIILAISAVGKQCFPQCQRRAASARWCLKDARGNVNYLPTRQLTAPLAAPVI